MRLIYFFKLHGRHFSTENGKNINFKCHIKCLKNFQLTEGRKLVLQKSSKLENSYGSTVNFIDLGCNIDDAQEMTGGTDLLPPTLKVKR